MPPPARSRFPFHWPIPPVSRPSWGHRSPTFSCRRSCCPLRFPAQAGCFFTHPGRCHVRSSTDPREGAEAPVRCGHGAGDPPSKCPSVASVGVAPAPALQGGVGFAVVDDDVRDRRRAHGVIGVRAQPVEQFEILRAASATLEPRPLRCRLRLLPTWRCLRAVTPSAPQCGRFGLGPGICRLCGSSRMKAERGSSREYACSFVRVAADCLPVHSPPECCINLL